MLKLRGKVCVSIQEGYFLTSVDINDEAILVHSAVASLLSDDTTLLAIQRYITGDGRGTSLFLQSVISLLRSTRLLSPLRDDSLIQFLGCARENFLDISSRFSTGLEALMDLVLASELDSAIKLYFTSFLQFSFVTYEVDANILCCMIPDLFQPLFQILKCFISCYIISQEDTVSSSIEDPGHRLERFLTCLQDEIKA